MEEQSNTEDAHIGQKTRLSQIQLLYRQSWTGLTGVLVVAVAGCIIFWPIGDQDKLVWWCGIVVLVTAARGALTVVFQRRLPADINIDTWGRWHVIGTISSAALWAVPTIFFWPGNPAYQIVWPLLILPLSAAAVATYHTWTPSYLSFLLITTLPMSARFFYEGGFLFAGLGLMSLFFIGVLALAGNVMHAASVNSFSLGIRNQVLNLTLQAKIAELESANANIRQLGGMLPICAACKNIRNDRGYWEQIESYFRDNSGLRFSHGMCPDCLQKWYPELHQKP